MRAALAAAALVLLAGCSGGGASAPPSGPWSPEQGGWPYPQPIDWTKYEPKDLKKQIDEAGKSRDCATIDRLFGEALDYPGQNAEVLTYIDRTGVHADCPNFPDEYDPVTPERDLEEEESTLKPP